MRNIILISVLIIFAGSGATLYFIRQADLEEQRHYRAEQDLRVENFTELHGKLEGFLNNVATQARNYRKARSVMTEAIKPENLRDSGDITMNLKMARATYDDLKGITQDIFQDFSDMERDLREWEQGKSDGIRAEVWAQWYALKNTRMSHYMEFFLVDKQILESHLDLLEYYNLTREQWHYNRDTNTLDFNNAGDAARAQEIQKRIKFLQERLQQIVSNNE